jgi:hypothetical protein
MYESTLLCKSLKPGKIPSKKNKETEKVSGVCIRESFMILHNICNSRQVLAAFCPERRES